MLKEVDEHGEFQTKMYTCITLIADEICKQVCALKVYSISVGKGQAGNERD